MLGFLTRIKPRPIWALTVFATLAFPLSAKTPEPAPNRNLERVLEYYRAAMGGVANLNRIQNIRIEGDLLFPNGAVQRVTVVKKRPNLMRMTFHAEDRLIVQAYNGELAWTLLETPDRTVILKMTGAARDSFVTNTPIENVFMNPKIADAELSLGETVLAGRVPCFVLTATYPNGSRLEITIDKEEYRDRLIANFSADGSLVTENIPSNFINVDGVVFAQRVLSKSEDQVNADFQIKSIRTNVGVLDSVFNPPLMDPAPTPAGIGEEAPSQADE